MRNNSGHISGARLQSGCVVSWLSLAGMLGSLLALSLCVQPLVDDWIYMNSSGDTFNEFWSCAGEPVRSWSDALRSCLKHYMHSNGRLTDKLFIIFSTVLPSWIGRLLCIASFGVGVRALLRMSGGDDVMRSPGFVSLLLCGIFILLPWSHYLTSLACEFNYLLPCGLCIPTMLWFLRPPRRPNLAIPVALLGGMMHESFSLGILTGMGVMLIVSRFRLTRKQWAIGLFFLAGTLVLMLAPGTFVRMGYAPTGSVTLPWLRHTLLTMPAVALTVVCAVAIIIKRLVTKRPTSLGREQMMLFTTALGSIIAGVLALQQGRAYWFGSLLLTGWIILTLSYLCPSLMRPHRIAGAMLGTLLTGWLTWCAVLQYGSAREAERLASAIADARGYSPVWLTLENEEDVNPWTLRIVQAPINEAFYNLKAQGYHFNPGKFDMSKRQGLPLPLPERFRGKHYTEWDSLPGGVAYGAYPVFYAPSAASRIHSDEMSAWVTFDVGNAPAGPYNLLGKLRGTRSVTVAFASPLLLLPKSRVAPADTISFTDPVTGLVPDTLCFIYPQERPRPLYSAPVTAIR